MSYREPDLDTMHEEIDELQRENAELRKVKKRANWIERRNLFTFAGAVVIILGLVVGSIFFAIAGDEARARATRDDDEFRMTINVVCDLGKNNHGFALVCDALKDK